MAAHIAILIRRCLHSFEQHNTCIAYCYMNVILFVKGLHRIVVNILVLSVLEPLEEAVNNLAVASERRVVQKVCWFHV
jgi:hypothetical protein